MLLYLATSNTHKIKEISEILPSCFNLRSPSELKTSFEPIEETGESFAENAFLKAQNFATLIEFEAAVLAEDSGLEVLALNGAPGVNSARYSSPHATDEENCLKLLHELKCHQKRSARFVCHLHLILPSRESVKFEAELLGSIGQKQEGKRDGFGYDPLFIPQNETKCLAQLGSIYKNQVSHRALALKKLILWLETKHFI